MNKPLCGTNLTGEMLEEAFVAAGRTTPGSLETVTAEKIVRSGGYTSDIFRVFLTWKEQGKNEILPSTILVKIPKQEYLDDMMESFDAKAAEVVKKAINIGNFTQIECNVYRMLAKEAPQVPIPKCYLVWTKEENSIALIATEDLSSRARIPDLARGLTRGQLINCAETIATLQAWSLNTQYDWKKEVPKLEKYLDPFLTMLGSVRNHVESSIEKYPAYLKCVNVEKICSTISNKEKVIAAMTEYRNLLPDVFVHGDLWANNILFQLDSNEDSISDRIAAIVDWPMSHQGSFGEDLCRLYAFSVDPDVRRCTMREVFGRYFEKMQILAPSVMKSVPFESAYHLLERAVSFYGLIMVAFAFQFATIILRDNPSLEAAVLSRLEQNYKDAAEFFNF